MLGARRRPTPSAPRRNPVLPGQRPARHRARQLTQPLSTTTNRLHDNDRTFDHRQFRPSKTGQPPNPQRCDTVPGRWIDRRTGRVEHPPEIEYHRGRHDRHNLVPMGIHWIANTGRFQPGHHPSPAPRWLRSARRDPVTSPTRRPDMSVTPLVTRNLRRRGSRSVVAVLDPAQHHEEHQQGDKHHRDKPFKHWNTSRSEQINCLNVASDRLRR